MLRRVGDAVGNAAVSAGKGLYNAVTGDNRTEFPEAPEFVPTYSKARGPNGELPQMGSALSSSITPDPNAQFDILSKSIPGLAKKTDKFGNMMLKAPGMEDWTYLNKPGISGRDLDEFGTTTLATLPLMGWAGKAGTTGMMMARGALGMGGASVAQDVGAMAQGSEQGIDPGRAAVSAGLGAAVPAALPLVAGTVGALKGGVERVGRSYQRYTNPEAYARGQVQGAFDEDAARGINAGNPGHQVTTLTPAEQAQAASRGQDLRTMDYGGGTVQDLARKSANESGAARDVLMRAIAPRYEGQQGRAADLFANEMGFNRSIQQVGDKLDQQARKMRQPAYDSSYRQGANGISAPELTQLQTSPIFARAMQRANATMLDRQAVPGVVTTGARGPNGYTLEYWDQVKRSLDDAYNVAKRQGANSKAMNIDQMRRSLRDTLDKAVPDYAHARSTAETFFDATDALEAGQKFASEKFDPIDAQHAIGALNAPERTLFQEGFARQVANDIRATGDRSNVLNRINSSEQERDRMKLGLGGGGRYAQLESFLRIEQMMDAARNAMGNSTTVRQLVQLGREYGIPAMLEMGAAGFHDPHAALAGIALFGFKLLDQRVDATVANHVAALLASKNPDMFLNGLKQASTPLWLAAIRAADNKLASVGVYRTIAQQTGVNAATAKPVEKQDERSSAAFDKARQAIAQGADRNAVMQRLLKSGINPRGL